MFCSSRELGDEGRERRRLLGVHAGGRLVEEQELRLASRARARLEAPLVAVGEVLRVLVVLAAQAREVEQLAAALLGLRLLRACSPGVRRIERTMPPLDAAVHRDEHVLERRHVVEEADVLERARHAEAVTSCGGRPAIDWSSKKTPPAVGL